MASSISVSSNALDVLNFVVEKGHGVKGLADMGLSVLPKQYIHPPQEQITNSTILTNDSIPMIDLSNWDDPNVANMICDAAEKWGFFQILNHGVPTEVLENVKEAAYRFFRLPAEEKNKYSEDHSPTDNVRYGTSFSPKTEKALEWKDFLSVFYVSDDMAAAFWPASCRNEVLDFIKRSESTIRKLLEILMRRLNVTEIDGEKGQLLMGSKRVHINYFPKCPEPELTVGVGRHSDASTLTFLLQDQVGGLYVKKLDGDVWIHVPPVAGAIVVNVGDALQILSNGRYKSIEHRVIPNGSSERISVPIFVLPRLSAIIGPLPEVLASGEKPIYKQVLYSDYLNRFFSKAHDGKETLDTAMI